MINGTCVQVQCAISGQQSINGICQCVNINSIVKTGSCECPVNSQVVGIACVCSIVGQTMLNGQCVCQTMGAFVSNNTCTCGLNRINTSNICSCPNGANFENGVCVCQNTNSYISGNQCVCPTYALLEGNTCTCPNNSQIINNQCVCNQITDQVMINGTCQCQTTGAFVNNGVCTCGINVLNVSNTCICPTNSSFVNNQCICDSIVGQSIINETCQCSFGQFVVNDTCTQMIYMINISNFECKQELFTQQFDIQSITQQINISSNFSAGYVFSSGIVIKNAFIDISNNVYTTTIYPIFQSQNSYINLKIQFGTQYLNSGSLILSSSTLIAIQQMNIVSRPGSQLTVNNFLNILVSTSTSANITNLLVNLTFAPSNGNITLISNIYGYLNISGYQVLGTYVSTQTVAMIGLNLNTVIVNVYQVSFKPSVYNIGNGSSYLFGNTINNNTNTIIINQLAILLGSSSNFQHLTNSQSSNYQYGGIIYYINCANSNVNVNNVIFDSYQHFTTNQVWHSGFLIGFVQFSRTCIILQNICLQQNISSVSQQFYYCGLIGNNQGNISILDASIFISVQVAYIHCFGIIGIQRQLNSEIINIKTTFILLASNCDSVGSIIGYIHNASSYIQNMSVQVGNISSGSNLGGIVGNQQATTNISVQNSLISQTNISGSSNIGGFVGICYSNLYLIQSKIQFVHLSSPRDVGIIVGLSYSGIYYFSNSSSITNYINGVQQSECTVLSNNWSVSGC
ncbi:Conserved_hypothetical protein [Hexamita inflata]|uniref:EGF-like domain-containing protein n=1 Tax=Hexamita inflata TaxID=28002 RepID=A0ABP1HA65_9EUKA